MRREEYAQARDAFLEGLRLLGPDDPKGSSFGVWFSTRLGILQGLAQCAAKLDEVPLARAYIEETMSLWKRVNIGPVTKYRDLSEWMTWANAYLAWSEGKTH
jgi:hypothetical protein